MVRQVSGFDAAFARPVKTRPPLRQDKRHSAQRRGSGQHSGGKGIESVDIAGIDISGFDLSGDPHRTALQRIELSADSTNKFVENGLGTNFQEYSRFIRGVGKPQK